MILNAKRRYHQFNFKERTSANRREPLPKPSSVKNELLASSLVIWCMPKYFQIPPKRNFCCLDTQALITSIRLEVLGIILIVALPGNILSAKWGEIEQLVGHKQTVQASGIRRVSMEEVVAFLVEDAQAWELTLERLFHLLV
jgi:hypothetical protein